MRFQPETEEELKAKRLFKDGIYPFAVMKAEEAISQKSGNEMLKLEIAVYGEGERRINVYEYLMPSMPEKLEQFCRMTGLTEKYLSGELQAYDVDNKQGYCFLKTQPAKDGYGPKNVISYYCPAPGGAGPAPKKPLIDDADQEIPF